MKSGYIPLWFYKVYDLIMVSAMYISPSQQISSGNWAYVGTVPDFAKSRSGYKYFGFVFIQDGGTNINGFGSVDVNGSMSMYLKAQLTTSMSLFGSFEYLIN